MKTLHILMTNAFGARTAQFVFKFLLCLMPFITLVNPTPAAAAQTIVSLTFDDGLNQSVVADMLAFHGMKGTFYVNSNLIGTGGGYLSKVELDTLVTNGNEIGGHTINHVDLATLTDAQQLAAICDDMATLNTWYPGQIHSFAYPFASTGPTTQSILAGGCPGVATYTNARSVGGIASGAVCAGCPTAETIPPGNPYFINTPESILDTDTLTYLQTLVTQAENNGGGWVPIVFHQVCNACDPYSISQATLEAFLTWLQPRDVTNNTYVRTVNQVMIGDLPPPPPPPPLGPNLLTNPSLELDANADNIADCWTHDSNGVLTAAWARVPDAHAGVIAEQVQVTVYSSGDVKLIPTADVNQAFGGCAPVVEAGASYQLGAWYKSTVPVTPTLFYQDAAGVWQYWKDGPLQSASATYTQMSFDSGVVPAGAQAISFGLALQAVGTLTTDDYTMQKVLNTTPDTAAPTVAVTAPVAGTVSGTVGVTATATDNVGVVGVQFQLDGVNLGAEVTAAPYTVSWDSTTVANGAHTLTAIARDAAGNSATSSGVAVTVSNADITAPTVALSAPAAGTVSGMVSVTATASDNVGVVGVQFQLDGVNLGAEVTASPYGVSWDSTTAVNGSHTLTAVARDAAGNTATSTGVTVTVSNADVTAPTVAISAPAAGTVSGTLSVTATASDNVGVVGVQFLLDGANLGAEDTTSPYSVSWDSTTIANGSHSLTAVARDAAGNSTTSAGVTVTVNNADITAPTVALSAPAAGTVSATISVAATASDNVGVVGVQFLLDGANLGAEDTTSPYSVSWDTTAASNGSHALTAVARDAAGNTTTSAAVTVTVNNPDTTAPTVALTAPAAGTVSGTINVAASASDNIGVVGVQFLLDGANLGAEDTTSPYSVSWGTASAGNGSHTLTAVARDAAGNTTTSAGVSVTVNNADTAAPTVALTAPAAGTVSGQVSVAATASDNVGVVGVRFLLDGISMGAEDTTAPYSIPWNSTSASNGSHAITAVARDAAGNTTTSAAVTVTVNNPDTTAPAVALTGPAAGTVSGQVSVSATASDNIGVAGVQFMLDGVNLGGEDTTAPYSVPWDTTSASNGSHTLTAVARDAAGNTTSAAAVTVTVSNGVADTTAPSVALTAPAAGTVSGTISVSATASDDVGVVGVQFLLDGANLGGEDSASPYSLSWDTSTASNGTHTLSAVARDAAGNTTTAAAIAVTVDNSVSGTSGGGGGSGSLGLFDLALMLMMAGFGATARNRARKGASDDRLG